MRCVHSDVKSVAPLYRFEDQQQHALRHSMKGHISTPVSLLN